MTSGRIDVHAHYLPDTYRAAAETAGHSMPDGFFELPTWSAAGHLELMDRLGIAMSLLSISSPGVHFGDDADARSLARQVNEEGRRAVEEHPGRFGLLAALPLPDVAGALEEIAYSFDVLGADGVAVLTNAGGIYLGDPVLEPVFDELDRRHARMFVHPTSPACWERVSLGRPRPMIEFFFDTTRALVNMTLNGTLARHPDLAVIVPHAGAALPAVADRVAAFSMALADVDPAADVVADLARLHFDLAGFVLPRQLDALLAITGDDHLHYGSDYPFTANWLVEALVQQLDAAGEPVGSLVARLTENTRRLFPRAAQIGAST
jgi:predicted TIM-barrel fold metal-dependent hydrolase